MVRRIGFTLVFCIVVSACSQNDIPVVEVKVQGIEAYDGPESGRKLLEENGFVAVPRYYHRIFGPYFDSDLPPFITADSVHRTFHVIFEESLKEFEDHAYKEMQGIITDLTHALPEAPPVTPEAHQLVQNYLLVTQCLLENQDAPEGKDSIATELALIHAAAGVGSSAVMPYKLDYSQFTPRGFYTQSPELKRYFKAMTWLGCVAFRQKSPLETEAALLLADLFRRTPDARERWNRLDKKYTQLLFQCDDLTLEEYTQVLDQLSPDVAALPSLDAFHQQVTALRDPRYNGMVLLPELMPHWQEETKGMRFMGRRYLPDGGVFDKVTDPKVKDRLFPSGLDVLAANGSARARLHLESAFATQPDYAAGLQQAAEELAQDKAAYADSHYIQIMKVMETLTAPPHEQAAPFVKTDAYADKNLMTALATWASTRHTWILHAKQNMAAGAGCPEPEPIIGYIEPNPDFFEAMVALGITSKELFTLSEVETSTQEEHQQFIDLPSERFQRFVNFVETIQALLDKQFLGKAYTEMDKLFFEAYGDSLESFHGSHAVSFRFDRSLWMGIVADVYSEWALERKCLEVATGGAMPIYALVPYKGKDNLVVGSMYSYFEFLQPVSERLTDEDWQDQWDRGDIPSLPPWSASFVAEGFDVDKIIKKLKAGEIPIEVLFIQDPELDEFLLMVSRGDEAFELDPYIRPNIVQLAAKKLPEEMYPILFGMLDKLEPPDYQKNDQIRKKLKTSSITPEERKWSEDFRRERITIWRYGELYGSYLDTNMIDKVYEIINKGPNHAAMVSQLFMYSNEKVVEELWLYILNATDSYTAVESALIQLHTLGSTDVLDTLLDFIVEAEGEFEVQAIAAFAEIVDPNRKFRIHRGVPFNAVKPVSSELIQKSYLVLSTYLDDSRQGDGYSGIYVSEAACQAIDNIVAIKPDAIILSDSYLQKRTVIMDAKKT